MGGETSESSEDKLRNSKSKKSTKRSLKTISKAKHRLQKYRSEWEKIEDFRHWLQPDGDSIYKAKCTYCNAVITAEFSVIRKHASGSKHQHRCKDIRPATQKTVTKFIAPVNEKVPQAEINLCANVPKKSAMESPSEIKLCATVPKKSAMESPSEMKLCANVPKKSAMESPSEIKLCANVPKKSAMESPSETIIEEKIGFIGGGNMAQAIAEGLIKTGTIPASHIMASAPSQRTFAKWQSLGAKYTNNNGEVLEQSDVIFIAVKPHLLDAALNSLRVPEIHRIASKLFISIVAGVTLTTLEEKLSGITLHPRVVRVMPNTPMMVGSGCSVFSGGGRASTYDLYIVRRLLDAGGICEEVPENLINSIGALTGSGPAFVYLMLEALSDGAVKMGVPRVMATQFAAQTVMGAARMVMVTGRHPGQLKDEVCSPGGTTIAGIHAMERAGIRGGLMDAIEASAKRCEEIGKIKCKNV